VRHHQPVKAYHSSGLASAAIEITRLLNEVRQRTADLSESLQFQIGQRGECGCGRAHYYGAHRGSLMTT